MCAPYFVNGDTKLMTTPKKSPAYHGRFDPAEYTQSNFFASVDPGVTPSRVLEPDFWAHKARVANVGDKISILATNNSWYGEYIVVAKTDLSLRIKPIVVAIYDNGAAAAGAIELEDDDQNGKYKATSKDGKFVVQYVNNKIKYRVIRLIDKKSMKSGIPTKEQAVEDMESISLAEDI